MCDALIMRALEKFAENRIYVFLQNNFLDFLSICKKDNLIILKYAKS